MNGQDHYDRAASILVDLSEVGSNMPADERAVIVASAQVHATLALAAATAHPVERVTVAWAGYGASVWEPE